MNFDVVLLGTGAAVPVPRRGTTSQFLDIHGHTYLIDAGEGTQLSLRRSNIRFQKLKGIFISHMHGDHVLGLPGVLSTMSLLGRKEPIDIWGPSELRTWLQSTWLSISAHLNFDIRCHAWSLTDEMVLHEGDCYRLKSFPVKHRIPCCGLKVEEHSLPWKLNGVKSKHANLPFHVRQALKRGEEIVVGEEVFRPSDWCKTPQEARSYVYSSDTRPCQSLLGHAKDATVLYHDATFAHDDQHRAKATYHSTALEAARLANNANVGTLVLGHVSLRYRDVEILRREALAEHPNVVIAEDGMVLHIGK